MVGRGQLSMLGARCLPIVATVVDGAVDETVDDDDYVFTQCCMYLNGETTIVLFA